MPAAGHGLMPAAGSAKVVPRVVPKRPQFSLLADQSMAMLADQSMAMANQAAAEQYMANQVPTAVSADVTAQPTRVALLVEQAMAKKAAAEQALQEALMAEQALLEAAHAGMSRASRPRRTMAARRPIRPVGKQHRSVAPRRTMAARLPAKHPMAAKPTMPGTIQARHPKVASLPSSSSFPVMRLRACWVKMVQDWPRFRVPQAPT